MTDKFLKELIEFLSTQKKTVGSFNENFPEIKNIVLMEFAACKEEFENDAITPDLMTAFMKIGKLLDVLTVFDITKEEKEKFESMGIIMRQVRSRQGSRSQKEI